MMSDDQIVEVVQAHKDGKPIERHTIAWNDDHWVYDDIPSWDFVNIEYRVKPEYQTYIKAIYDQIVDTVPVKSLNFVDNDGRLSLKMCLAGMAFGTQESEPLLALLRVLPQLKGRTVKDVTFTLMTYDKESNPYSSFAELIVDTENRH